MPTGYASGLFDPPTQPSFPYEPDERWDTIQDPFEAGYVQTRSRWGRVKRRIKMVWENGDQATRDYVKMFVDAQLGAATSFSWQFPTTALYQAAPPLRPSMINTLVGGALGSRTYYVRCSFRTALGETVPGPRDSITLANARLLRVYAPRFPAGITGYRVYASQVSGSETLQATITTSQGSWDEPSSGLVSGASPLTVTTANETLTLHFEADSLLIREEAAGVWYIEIVAVELFV